MIENLVYFAGLFDGEGCIQVSRTLPRGRGKNVQHHLLVQITNTDKEVLVQAREIFGGTVVRDSPRRGTHQEVFRWRCCGLVAAAALERMFPYLRIKREQARVGLMIRKTYDGRRKEVTMGQLSVREDIRQKLRLLKRPPRAVA